MDRTNPWNRVEEIVAEVNRSGTAGVSLIGPNGATWQHLGDRIFNPASTLKIPVMVEIHRKIDAGELHLDDPWTLSDEVRVGGSGVLNQMRSGATITLYDLLYLMISISDNVATDALIQMTTIEAINRTTADLGMKNSRLAGTLREAFAGAPELGRATPNDYAGAIAAILDGKAASEESCAAMTALLETQQNRSRIARYLPVPVPLSEAIRWGSKNGTTRGVCNDAGFIIGPNGKLIIAIYTEHYADTHVAEQVIGEIARAAMADTGIAGPMYTS